MLDKIADYLLVKETITGSEMMAIIEGRDPETAEDSFRVTAASGKAKEAPAAEAPQHASQSEGSAPAPAEEAPSDAPLPPLQEEDG